MNANALVEYTGLLEWLRKVRRAFCALVYTACVGVSRATSQSTAPCSPQLCSPLPNFWHLSNTSYSYAFPPGPGHHESLFAEGRGESIFRRGGQGSIRLGQWKGVMCAEKAFAKHHEATWATEVNTGSYLGVEALGGFCCHFSRFLAAVRLKNAHAHITNFYLSEQSENSFHIQMELCLTDLFDVFEHSRVHGYASRFFAEFCACSSDSFHLQFQTDDFLPGMDDSAGNFCAVLTQRVRRPP